jgi:hypothetical protein
MSDLDTNINYPATVHNVSGHNNTNPLFLDQKLSSLDNKKVKDIPQFILRQKFKKLYCICLSDEINQNNFNKDFYNSEISYMIKQKMKTTYKLCKIHFNTLLVPKIKNDLVLLSKDFISNINNCNYKLDDYNLCVLFLNIKKEDMLEFTQQFYNYKELKHFYSLFIMNAKYNVDINVHIFKKAINILKNIDSHRYWDNPKNTKLNQTIGFLNRKLDFKSLHKLKDEEIRSIVSEIDSKQSKENDYLSYMYRDYWDLAEIIKKKGYRKYYINHEVINKYVSCEFDQVLETFIKDDNTRIQILKVLLLNKDLLHLVLKSKFINLIDWKRKDMEVAFRYAFFTCTLEENINKSYSEKTNRNVFTLREATQLPTYFTKPNDVLNNPYFTFPVSRKVIDINNNFQPIHYNGCLVDMQTYLKRLNLFITKDRNFDIFEGLEIWNQFGVTGSVNAAIIPEYNGIFLQQYYTKKYLKQNEPESFLQSEEYEYRCLDKYYSTHFPTSDIDIMNNNPTVLGYLIDVQKLLDVINTNLSKYHNKKINTNITFFKEICIVVNVKFLREFILNKEHKNDNINKDELTHLVNHNQDYKKKIYEYYIKYQILNNEKYIDNDMFKDTFYNKFFEIVPIDSTFIIIKKTQKDWEEYNKQNQLNTIYDKQYEVKCDRKFNFSIDNCLCGINFNLKVKINIYKTNRVFEVFRIKNRRFMGMVQKFHCDCVRAFYQGPYENNQAEVYLLPTAITAYKTGLMQYPKYVAGKYDYAAVFLKYFRYGYAYIWNKNELIKLIEYINRVDKWKNLFKIKSYNDTNLIIGNPRGKFIFTTNNNIGAYNFNFEQEHCILGKNYCKKIISTRLTPIVDREGYIHTYSSCLKTSSGIDGLAGAGGRL